MDDGLYDFRTWPQAGRDQLHKALLKGKEKHLEQCLKGELVSYVSKDPKKISEVLDEVRQALKKLS